MSCLHRDEALKDPQCFTSHWPKAGPPDMATQPPELTRERGEKEHFVKGTAKRKGGCWEWKRVHFSSASREAPTHLAGVCSSWWRWEACWRRWSASGTLCCPPPPSGPSSSACYCLPHFHLVNYWWRPVQTCQEERTHRWGGSCQTKSIRTVFFSSQVEAPVFHREKRTLAVIFHHGIFIGLFMAGNPVAGMSITYPGLKHSQCVIKTSVVFFFFF